MHFNVNRPKIFYYTVNSKIPNHKKLNEKLKTYASSARSKTILDLEAKFWQSSDYLCRGYLQTTS